MDEYASPPRATPLLMAYALLDALGMLVFASGAMWLVNKQPLLVTGFPDSPTTALLAVATGVSLMWWSAARIMRELIKHRPDKGGDGDGN